VKWKGGDAVEDVGCGEGRRVRQRGWLGLNLRGRDSKVEVGKVCIVRNFH